MIGSSKLWKNAGRKKCAIFDVKPDFAAHTKSKPDRQFDLNGGVSQYVFAPNPFIAIRLSQALPARWHTLMPNPNSLRRTAQMLKEALNKSPLPPGHAVKFVREECKAGFASDETELQSELCTP
jgi:hypothetical protein